MSIVPYSGGGGDGGGGGGGGETWGQYLMRPYQAARIAEAQEMNFGRSAAQAAANRRAPHYTPGPGPTPPSSRRHTKKMARPQYGSLKGRGKKRMASGASKRVEAPKVVGYIGVGRTPMHLQSGKADGSIIVRHREYIMDIVSDGSGGYENPTSIRINPGASGSFPWLTQLSKMYEKYKFQNLVFKYEPQIGTDGSGTIMLAVDYDPTDAAPPNKQEFLLLSESTRSPLWKGCYLRLKQPDLDSNNADLIKSDADRAQLSAASIVQADVGNVFVTVAGSNYTGTVGELWAEYSVKLHNPQYITSGDTAYDMYTHWNVTKGGEVAVGNAYLFGNINPLTNTRTHYDGNLPVTIDDTGDYISLTNIGSYTIYLHVIALSGTRPFLEGQQFETTGSTVQNITNFLSYIEDTTSVASVEYGARFVCRVDFDVTAPGQRLDLQCTAIANSVPSVVDNVAWYLFFKGTAPS